MKSVRIDGDLRDRLARAARALAISESEFVREAVVRRCNEVLANSLAERLASVIGIAKSAGGRATNGKCFSKIVAPETWHVKD